MNLALSESLGQEFRFAKRINSNGVTELKLWTKEVWIWIWTNFEIWKFQKHVWVGLLDWGDHNEEVGVGFVGFGQTSKNLWLFEKLGPSCFTKEKISTVKL